jgi:hypothetical protein
VGALAAGAGFVIFDITHNKTTPPAQIDTRGGGMAASHILDFTETVRREGAPTLRVSESAGHAVIVFPVPALNVNPSTTLDLTLQSTAPGSGSIRLSGVRPDSYGRGIVSIDVHGLLPGAYTLEVTERKPGGAAGGTASFPFELAKTE